MAIVIFTTTSPEVAEPCVRRLSSAAVSSSITFLAMSQKLSNFVFFPLLMRKSQHNAGSAFLIMQRMLSSYSACF